MSENKPGVFDNYVNVCDHVMKNDVPILFVSHSRFGTWNFLCGVCAHYDNVAMVPEFAVLEIDSSVNELSEMPRGHYASRKSKDSPWKIQKD